MRLMYPVEGSALRLTEGGAASLAPVAPLFLAMDHDVSLPGSPVGPTGLVVAELLSRVHGALLLLTLYTSKDAPESAFRSTHPHIHGCVGCYLSDLVGVFAPVAGEKDLATAQGEGIR